MVGEHLEQLLRLRMRTLATVTDMARRFDRRLLHDDKFGTRQRQGSQVLETPVIRRPVLGAVLTHWGHRVPDWQGGAAEAKWFEQGMHACHQNEPGELNSLIADDGAALVAYPIPEAQVVDPYIGKAGAHRRCGT
jgi:hypothetical protein